MARTLASMKKKVLEVHTNKISEPSKDNPNGRFKTRIDVYDSETKQTIKKQLVKTDEYVFYETLCLHYGIKETETRKKTTIASLYPEWLDYKKLHTNASTYIARIESDWKKYYVGTKIINKDITGLTKLELDEWAHKIIQDYSLSKNAYYNMALIIRQLLNYAVDKDLIFSNPFNKVVIDSRRMFRKTAKKCAEEEVFTRQEFESIERVAMNDYHGNEKLVYKLSPLAVIFQFQTGLRVGELCGVKFDDVHGDYIHIQRMVRNYPFEVVEKTKTEDGDRMVFLTHRAKEIIEEARRNGSSDFIFGQGIGKPLKPSAVQDRYTAYCEELGITHRSSHKARKTYNSALIDAGVNLDTVRRLMGHASEQTTLRNYTYDRAEKSLREQKIEKALG